MTTQPFGAWASPITTDLITGAVLDIVEVHADSSTGKIYHIEARPWEAGRNVLVETRTGEEVTPSGGNTRCRVHEYGGAAAIVSQGRAIMSDFASFDVICRDFEGGKWSEPRSIVPENKSYRYGNFDIHPTNRDLVLAVLEDHTKPDPADVVNSLVLIDVSKRSFTPFAGGHDFYAAPRWSKDGKLVTFVAWNHPNMPWEESMLYVNSVDSASEPKLLAGGSGNSVSQPRWLGNRIVYLSDESNWYDLYSIDPEGGKAVTLWAAERDLGGPDWMLGQSSYTVIDDDQILIRSSASALTIISASRARAHRSFDNEFRSIGQLQVVSPEQIVFVGIAATEPSQLVSFDPTSDPAKVEFKTLKKVTDQIFDEGYVAAAIDFSFPAGPDPGQSEKTTSYAQLYLPKNKDFIAPAGEKPPCIIRVHGGPTSAARRGFNSEYAWWTSRGWAIADVDYGGSTGRGKVYRDRLKGQWGVVDAQDVIDCVKALGEQGKVDPKRVAISGGSAGGYTVLLALTRSKTFGTGASLYGVADLGPLASDTHKFESQYLYRLIGGTPEQVPELYKDRSPINHVDNISAPMLILQGADDKVVLPNQATMIYDAVKAKGLKAELIIFEGEGHGFRKAENIKRSYESQLTFFSDVFGIKQ